MAITTLKSTEIMMALLFLSNSFSDQQAKMILGLWRGEEESSRQIEMYQEKDGSYSGKIINDTGKNSKNGYLIFKQLRYDEANNVYKGLMSPPDVKFSINATITLTNPNRIEVVGKKVLISKTFHFIRIQ